MNKPVIETQRVTNPARERLAATRKRTLRSVPARGARSVWSECLSRVIESRKTFSRLGLPVFARGDNITLPTISRSLHGAQATGRATGPGSESGAEAHGGFLKSWERHTAPSNHRTRTTPVKQRPGAKAGFSGAIASEDRKATKEPFREGKGRAGTNFKTTLPPAQSDLAQGMTKDPYRFDFLALRDGVTEREIEEGLIGRVEKFLLELGAGFAHVGRQVHLEVGDQDFYLDLFFYHLKLRCFLVIDLKAREFAPIPEATGKMNFYLSAI